MSAKVDPWQTSGAPGLRLAARTRTRAERARTTNDPLNGRIRTFETGHGRPEGPTWTLIETTRIGHGHGFRIRTGRRAGTPGTRPPTWPVIENFFVARAGRIAFTVSTACAVATATPAAAVTIKAIRPRGCTCGALTS